MSKIDETSQDNKLNILDILSSVVLVILTLGNLNDIDFLIPNHLTPAQSRRRIRIIALIGLLFYILMFIVIDKYGIGILVFLAFGWEALLGICGL